MQPPPPDDLGPLIEAARAGDAVALQELFARHREPLLVRIRRMMGNEARRVAESDDFLQSTFTAALPGLEGFELRSPDSFLRWLTTIARNKIAEDLRRRREQALSQLSDSLLGAPAGDDGAAVAAVDRALTLLDALARLQDEEGRLIELRDLESRSFGEIAAQLGVSERQAQRMHARALLRLSRVLRGHAPGAG